MGHARSVPNIDLGDEIGHGSFGRVWRGRHRTLDVDVAVKLVDTDRVQDVGDVLAEARLMARLDHPNLLRILDAGRTESALYLVLEMMDGTCAGERPVGPDRAVDLALQLLSGLQALHDARVLHRDIKPANCLVRARDGRVKLADLGIAVEQSVQSGRPYDLAGTLPFMAPEVFENPPQFSPASDLYALGRTLQCLVLERDPFPRASTAAVMAWIHECEAPAVGRLRPDLPPSLTSLIDRLCARDVTHRPLRAAEAIAALTSSVSRTARGPDDEPTVLIVGSWVLGTALPADKNFDIYAATHLRTGAPARLALMKRRCPLAETAPLVLASAERASRLSHPGIAAVTDWGVHDGRVFVVTRAQGRDLDTLVRSGGPLDEMEALAVVRDLADALAYLHGAGLVYQVVNPRFAMRAMDARAVQFAWPMFCVDAGSAAQPGGDAVNLVSIPLYAPPESLTRSSWSASRVAAQPGLAITERADLYGLGEILFFLIAGRPSAPVDLEIPALVYHKVSGPARLRDAVPSVLASTDQLVADLTQPDPARRPASAVEVRQRIDRIQQSLTPEAPS